MPWAEASRLGNCAERVVGAGEADEEGGFTGEEAERACVKMVNFEVLWWNGLQTASLCGGGGRNSERGSVGYKSGVKIHKIYR